MQTARTSSQARRSRLVASIAAAALLAAAPAGAAERQISLPAGPLEAALTALAAQTGDQLLYPPEVAAGRRVASLSGSYSTETALARLIGSDHVVVSRVGPRVVVLKRRTARGASAPQGPELVAGRPFAGEPDAAAEAAAEAHAAPAVAGAGPSTQVDELTVTGSHIRGGSPAAPVLVLDRQALESTGHATVAAALQALPQNFGGESTEGTVATRADRLATNTGYATGVNLRGLGSDATLVLVNGRRMAGSGNRGDFADLSSLPMVAVERVEILLDGASALYGSDAVGGVVNVILKRQLEGGELRLRAGAADGLDEGVLAGVLGRTWSGGSLMAAYEGYHRSALSAAARAATGSADLRPLGGSDWRETFSFPGNIVRTDPATGTAAPFWGIPAGQPGTGLRPADFVAGRINRYNQNSGLEILPDQRRHSAYLAARQALGAGVEISADLRYGFRKVRAVGTAPIATLTVGRANPFFVSPINAASHQVQYNFGGEGGHSLADVGVESLTASIGADAELWSDWRGSGYVAIAQEDIRGEQSGLVNSIILGEALGNTADNPATAYNRARDGAFNPFGGQAGANTAGVLGAITSGFTTSRNRTQVRSANLQLDGSILPLPAGALKAAVGLHARREDFRSGGTNYTFSAAPTAVAGLDRHRDMVAAYAEVRLPLFGPDNRRPGLERLELSGAVRAETYSDFGRTVNPRLGVQWSPLAGLQLRATYGESFRAPALIELYSRRLNGPVTLSAGDLRVRSLALQGGNPDLGPETAESWTLGFDLEPSSLPGLRLAATWFETIFVDRIDRPLANARTTALVDPRLVPFVVRISPGTNPADFARIAALLADPVTSTAQGVFQPTDFGAIIDQRYVNTAGLKVSGLDLQASYGRDLRGGRLTLAGNASWMLDYQQAITPAAPFVEAAGDVGFPTKFRGRASADWRRDGLSLGVAVNHLGGFNVPTGGEVDSSMTVDVQAGLTAAPATRFAGLSLTLSVRNLFDAAPPFYDNPAGFGYDSASADIVGRYVALQLARRW